MAEGRAKRVIKTPKRYEDSDEVYWFPERLRDPDRNQQTAKRLVYHLLKRKDVTEDLIDREVHVFWPEDGQWYRCEVEEVNPRNLKIYVHYLGDDEYESIRAGDLVRDGHLAFLEERQHGEPLKRGDIPMDEQDKVTATYIAGEDSGDEEADVPDEEYAASSDDGNDSADAEFEDTDSDEERRLRNERLRGERGDDAPSSGQKKKKSSQKRELAAPKKGHVQVNRKRAAEHAAAVAKRARTEAGPSSGQSQQQASEQLKNAVIGLLAPRLAKDGGSGASQGAAANGSAARPVQKPQLKAAQAAAQEADIRKRAAEQLVNALQLAVGDIRRKGKVAEDKIGKPAEIGPVVEEALYKANGGLTKDYKTKFRTLVWNLKDPNNPDLRARVVLGELAPDVLVNLSSAELASKELNEMREKKAEEFAKAKFLDSETAAKYSTAAAAELKEQRHQALQQVSGKLTTLPADQYQTARPDEAPDEDREGSGDMQEGEENRGEGDMHVSNGDMTTVGAHHSLDAHHLDSMVSSMLIETGSSFLLEPGASGRLPDAAHTSTLGRHGSGEGGLVLLPRASMDGVSGEGMAGTSSAGTGAKVVSLKPATPSVSQHGHHHHHHHRDEDTYNPDDFIIGDDEDPSTAQNNNTDTHTHTHKHHHHHHSHDNGDRERASSLPRADSGHHGHGHAKHGGSAASQHGTSHHHSHHHGRAASGDAKQAVYVYTEDEGEVDDLAPVVPGAAPGSAAGNTPPGTPVWHGRLAAVECGVVHVACAYIGGPQELVRMLPLPAPSLPQELEVKGTLRQAKVEEFLEELQARSRSRCATLGLIRAFGSGPTHTDTTQGGQQQQTSQDEETFNKLVAFYAVKQRAGVCHPEQGLEAYLLPNCRLARRLLKTAQMVAQPGAAHLIPTNVPQGQLLMAVIHRRDWHPPGAAPTMLPPPPPTQQHSNRPVDPRTVSSSSGPAQDPRQAARLPASMPTPPHDTPTLPQMSSLPLNPAPSAAIDDTQALPPPPPLAPPGAETASPAVAAAAQADAAAGAAAPPIDSNALSGLLARLAQNLPAATASPKVHEQLPPPPPQPVELPAQYQLHPNEPATADAAAAPTEQRPALDLNALSALSAALQTHLGGPPLGAAQSQPQPQPQQPYLLAPGAAHDPSQPPLMVMPGAATGGAGAPLLQMNPDGSYQLLGGAEGGLPSVLMLPVDQPQSLHGPPPHGTPTHAPPPYAQGPPPGPHGAWPPPSHSPYPPAPPHGAPPGPHVGAPRWQGVPPGPPGPPAVGAPAPMVRQTPPGPPSFPGRGPPRGPSPQDMHGGHYGGRGGRGGRGGGGVGGRPYSGWDR